MYIKRVALLMTCTGLLYGCGEEVSQFDLQQLDGPAAELVASWESADIATKEIHKKLATYMNADGTEIYVSPDNKQWVKRAQTLPLQALDMTLQEALEDLVGEMTWEYVTTAKKFPRAQTDSKALKALGKEGHLVRVVENAKTSDVELLVYVEGNSATLHKVHLPNYDDAYNEEAEQLLTDYYNEIIVTENKEDNAQAPEPPTIEEPQPEPVALEVNEGARLEIAGLISSYLYTYAAGDTENLHYYISPQAAFYNEQMAYINKKFHLAFSLEIVDHAILSIERLDTYRFGVTVWEKYWMEEAGVARDIEQTGYYTVEYVDGAFRIVDLQLL